MDMWMTEVGIIDKILYDNIISFYIKISVQIVHFVDFLVDKITSFLAKTTNTG